MRKLILPLLLVLLLLNAAVARAENNPLLTVFEGIKVGMMVSDVKGALDAMSPANRCFCYLQLGLPLAPSVVKAEWTDSTYGDYNNKEVPARPGAVLIIEMDSPYYGESAKIVKVTYRYQFLQLKKELVKQ